MPLRVQPCKPFADTGFPTQEAARPDELSRLAIGNFFSAACNFFLVHSLCVIAAGLLVAAPSAVAQTNGQVDARAADLQGVVDALRSRMGIAAPVRVSIVAPDARVVSVRRSGEVVGAFALAVERAFVTQLPADQVEAVLAHELGHVWIYTHHPYLQTEQLANEVAMRVVPRARLVEVYRSLWGADAVHGSLAAFLGVEARSAAQQ